MKKIGKKTLMIKKRTKTRNGKVGQNGTGNFKLFLFLFNLGSNSGSGRVFRKSTVFNNTLLLGS